MFKDKVKAIVYQYLNITSLYIAFMAFGFALIVDFFKGGDENG